LQPWNNRPCWLMISSDLVQRSTSTPSISCNLPQYELLKYSQSDFEVIKSFPFCEKWSILILLAQAVRRKPIFIVRREWIERLPTTHCHCLFFFIQSSLEARYFMDKMFLEIYIVSK
jgi:hypothetical protein